MATAKNKGKQILAFTAPTEATTKPREVLFTWAEGEDVTEFDIPHADDIGPNVLVDIFDRVDENPISGIGYLFRVMLGDEQYAEFKKLPLTKQNYELLSTKLMEHISGAYAEDSKGKA